MDERSDIDFMVTRLGSQRIILGFTWLTEMNPIIDLQKGTLEWRKWKHSTLRKKQNKEPRPVTINTEKDKEEHLNRTQNPLEDEEFATIISTITGNMENGAWINSKSTTATAIQAEITNRGTNPKGIS